MSVHPISIFSPTIQSNAIRAAPSHDTRRHKPQSSRKDHLPLPIQLQHGLYLNDPRGPSHPPDYDGTTTHSTQDKKLTDLFHEIVTNPAEWEPSGLLNLRRRIDPNGPQHACKVGCNLNMCKGTPMPYDLHVPHAYRERQARNWTLTSRDTMHSSIAWSTSETGRMIIAPYGASESCAVILFIRQPLLTLDA